GSLGVDVGRLGSAAGAGRKKTAGGCPAVRWKGDVASGSRGCLSSAGAVREPKVRKEEGGDTTHAGACNTRAAPARQAGHRCGRDATLHRHAVPPTVRPSTRKVGWPTPTGTLWPSLPHTPTPVSSFMSSPIRLTRVSTSGPLPISVAPLTGYWIRP